MAQTAVCDGIHQCKLYVTGRFLLGSGLASPANAARAAGASKPRQIPGWIFVDLTFQIKVQGPKFALGHMSSRFRAGGYTPYYSTGRHRLSYAQTIGTER